MERTGMYRRQHSELRLLLNELSAMVKEPDIFAHGPRARSALARLLGLLKVHLAMEDRNLYPMAVAASDDRLRRVAQRLSKEGVRLAEEADEFFRVWTRQAIEAESGNFQDAVERFASVLRRRMEREDEELYPLVDLLES